MNVNLQRAWTLLVLRMPTSDEVIVDVVASEFAGYPDPVGRQGHKVIAEPAIWQETCRAEIRFTDCIVLRVWDDAAMLDVKSEEVFEGDTFRTYTRSSLLTTLDHLSEVGSLFHYRFFVDSGSTVLDVVTRKSPTISIRELQPASLDKHG